MSQFEIFTALRYSKPSVGKGTAGLLSGLSLLGLGLSVFGLIVVMSVMNGFERELQDRMLSLTPHAKIQWDQNKQSDWQVVQDALLMQPEIVAVAPYSEGSLVLSAAGQVAVARLTGIDTDAEKTFSQLPALIRAGDYEQLDRPFTIAIGAGLARRLGLTIGDSVNAILPRIQITPFGAVTREKSLTIVAVFESGTVLDSALMFSNLDTAKKMLAKRNSFDGLKINSSNAYAKKSMIQSALQSSSVDKLTGVKLSTWQEENAALYSAVVMEKLMIFILLICVVAVASFSIIAIVLMTVLDKKTDIAILRTMGANARQIKSIFLLQGSIIGIVGTLAGAALACVVAPHIGTLFSGLEKAFGFQLFDPNVYYIAHLPSELRMPDVLIVTIVSIVISMLVSIFPAARASQVDPVTALAVSI